MKKYILLLVAIFVMNVANVVNAQWVKTSLYEYSNVEALVIKGTTIYAGTVKGMYVSTNNGVSWNLKISDTSCVSIASNGNTIYTGTVYGIYLSNNNGTTWVHAANNQIPQDAIYALTVSGNNIFAGFWGGIGIYLSTNNGNDWVQVNNGLTEGGTYIRALASSGNNIFAGTGDGIFRSTDNGSTWTAINNGISQYSHMVNSIVINGNKIYAGTTGYGIYLSTDNGDSWTSYGLSISTDVEAIAVNNDILFAGTGSSANYNKNNVYFSIDNWNNWYATGLANTSTLNIGEDYVFAGTGGLGLWKLPLKDTIKTFANPINSGTTTGSGIYSIGNSCTVKAMPNMGYGFVNWTDNGNIVSMDTVYTFTVLKDRNLVANFVSLNTIITSSNIAIGGTTYGGGLFIPGQQCSVNAVSYNGYAFVDWTENGNIVCTNENYIFTVNGNRNLVANFTQTLPQYNITTYAIPTIGGTIIGSGTFTYNQICTLTAIPDTDYIFTDWTDNDVIICIDTSFSFIVTGNRYLFANFTVKPVLVNDTLITSINIHPNPTKDNLTIETNTKTEQRLEIINLMGQTVYTNVINKKATINTSAFANGVYILKLFTDKETVVKKFIKD